MGKTSPAYNLDQRLQLPPEMREWVPERHLAQRARCVVTSHRAKPPKDVPRMGIMSINLCKTVVMGGAIGLPLRLPARRSHPCRLFSMRPGRPRSQGRHDSALEKMRTTRVRQRISSLRRFSLSVLFLCLW